MHEYLKKQIEAEEQRKQKLLEEHTLKIKNKVESGSAIDKSIVDREANKELNHKEAHSKAKIAKAIEHKLVSIADLSVDSEIKYSTVILDGGMLHTPMLKLYGRLGESAHLYIICSYEELPIIHSFASQYTVSVFQYVHTFKYSSKSHTPKIGYKEHLEYIIYINKGNKPVNHLLPNVIESTYAKDSRNLGFYTNLLLRSANAGDNILGINITNGNLIKAAQAMLCSTVIIPVDNVAMKDCEKTIKELQFK